ncbi:hypothetical protein [uncultured Ruegeria sp.]|uniref:hypothetical protein n=1 Tax=uncultured Ruegeria sp. TaxID=259304 RepID=UPI0026131963|nr:hypothetical protein [uncultured Ruegeria sp.]
MSFLPEGRFALLKIRRVNAPSVKPSLVHIHYSARFGTKNLCEASYFLGHFRSIADADLIWATGVPKLIGAWTLRVSSKKWSLCFEDR